MTTRLTRRQGQKETPRYKRGGGMVNGLFRYCAELRSKIRCCRQIEETGIRGRRRKHLPDDLRETRGYWRRLWICSKTCYVMDDSHSGRQYFAHDSLQLMCYNSDIWNVYCAYSGKNDDCTFHVIIADMETNTRCARKTRSRYTIGKETSNFSLRAIFKFLLTCAKLGSV